MMQSPGSRFQVYTPNLERPRSCGRHELGHATVSGHEPAGGSERSRMNVPQTLSAPSRGSRASQPDSCLNKCAKQAGHYQCADVSATTYMFGLRVLRICRSRNTTAPTQGLIGNTNIGIGFRAKGVYFLSSLSCPSRYRLISRTKILAVAVGMITRMFSFDATMVNRSAVAALAWLEFSHFVLAFPVKSSCLPSA